MGNLITNDKVNPDHYIQMSNGLTSVFFDLLTLSASSLAKNNWEIETAIWFAEHDQGVIGLGIVGFDVADMGWEKHFFSEQKKFIISVTKDAMNGHSWNKLSYEPRPEVICKALEDFYNLIFSFQEVHMTGEPRSWYVKPDPPFEKCLIHQVYLHRLGKNPLECCLLCE